LKPLYKRNLVESILKVQPDGKFVNEVQITTTALEDGVETFDHFFEPNHRANNVDLKPLQFDCGLENESKKVSYEIFRESKDSFKFQDKNTPPLKRNEKITYYFKYTPNKIDIPFTIEEAESSPVIAGLNLKNVATDSWLIIVPTERLKLEIRFPDKYEIKNPSFSVALGYTNNIFESEIERLKKENAFKLNRFAGRIQMTLNVVRPLIGYAYWMYWTPPSEKEVTKS
ncbi:MAG: hypothetical protein J7K36_04110, partial [Archaeoglobaceae archaeon]|nr:hypothetical protein [Archaeoglobaceae archaeon]